MLARHPTARIRLWAHNNDPAPVFHVTAFLTRNKFRKWAADIAWETEVWIAEAPDHLIHFDGKKFLGPYE
jgi:type II restriction enzyme